MLANWAVAEFSVIVVWLVECLVGDVHFRNDLQEGCALVVGDWKVLHVFVWLKCFFDCL